MDTLIEKSLEMCFPEGEEIISPVVKLVLQAANRDNSGQSVKSLKYWATKSFMTEQIKYDPTLVMVRRLVLNEPIDLLSHCTEPSDPSDPYLWFECTSEPDYGEPDWRSDPLLIQMMLEKNLCKTKHFDLTVILKKGCCSVLIQGMTPKRILGKGIKHTDGKEFSDHWAHKFIRIAFLKNIERISLFVYDPKLDAINIEERRSEINGFVRTFFCEHVRDVPETEWEEAVRSQKKPVYFQHRVMENRARTVTQMTCSLVRKWDHGLKHNTGVYII